MTGANTFMVVSAAMLVGACASTVSPPESAPSLTISSVAANGNDCAVMAAVAKGHYGASRDDPPVRVTLDGAIASERWTADCDWAALGANYVEDDGPTTPPELMNMAHISFQRPRYDDRGALVITQMTPPGAPPSPGDPISECRVHSGVAGWTAGECQPARRAG